MAGAEVSVGDDDAAGLLDLERRLAELVADPTALDQLSRMTDTRSDPPLSPGPGGGGSNHGGGGGGGGGGNWRPPAEPDEDTRRLTGLVGEWFIYNQLQRWLPGFDETCWKSRNRTAAGFTGEGNDGLGYDFEYVDRQGKLSLRPGVRCLIEVKSSRDDSAGPFHLTRKEWATACAKHGSDSELYLIIRVTNVATAPVIADILRDPLELMRRRSLELLEKDYWVHIRTHPRDEDAT